MLTNAPGILQRTLPKLAGATVAAISNAGLNLTADVVTGRDIDWEQTLAGLPVDFVFSLVSSGWSGDSDLPDVNKRVIEPETYISPETGDAITVPKGKSLADVDAEAARFYEGAATAIEIDKTKLAEDLFLEYSDSLGVDHMPPLSEFKKMFNDGGASWQYLTLKKQWKDAISKGDIQPFTGFEEYKGAADNIAKSAPELAASYGGDIKAAVNDVTNKVFETGKPVADVVEGLKNPDIDIQTHRVDNLVESIDDSAVIDYDLVKEYILDIEQRTGIKIPKNQIEELKNALLNKEYRKLTKIESKKHRKDYTDIRSDLISQWEKNTGQKWPVYEEDVISPKTGKVIREAGREYDAHHIIEVKYGGDNEWWNIHPARYPDMHQAGIHGKNSPASKLFNGGY